MRSGWSARRITNPAVLVAVLLASFGVVLGCAIATGELLRLAEQPGGSTAPDSSITSWMVAHRTGGLTTLARVCSTVGSQTVLLPATALVAVVLVARRRLLPAGLLVAAWGGAIGLYNLTKYVVDRPRPPADIWLTHVTSTSFPSGHATQSLATFVALALVGALWLPRARRPGRVLALVLAAAVGCSRVYLGVHWATDVAAGWLIGGAWVAIVIGLTGLAKSAPDPPLTQ